MRKLLTLLLTLLPILFLVGCLGHQANTTGASSQKDIELEVTSGGGPQYIYAPTYIQTQNEQTATQKPNNNPSSSSNASLGWNGGAASQAFDGAKAASEGIATINKLMDLGKETSKAPNVEDVEVKKPQTDTPTGGGVSGKEVGRYHGRHNGDRATWYFSKNMSEYPETFTLTVEGCADSLEVTNNGHRWEQNGKLGYIVKQSDVSGRGMALVAPASCKSEKATIVY